MWLGDLSESVWILHNMPEKERDVFTSNSMISLFGKSNMVEDAEKVFDEMGRSQRCCLLECHDFLL